MLRAVADVSTILDSFTLIWAPRVVAFAATLAAIGVIWRYIVPAAKAVMLLADRFGDIAEHGESIDRLADRIETLDNRVEEMIEKNDRDHEWSRTSITAIAEWTDQFEQFQKMQLPPHPEEKP